MQDDDLITFVASGILVWVAYAVQTLVPCCTVRKWKNHNDYRLLFAAVFSVVVGIIKETVKVVWMRDHSSRTQSKLWCPCEFDIRGLIFNVNGVAAALVILIVFLWLSNQCNDPLPPCDDTVASSVMEMGSEMDWGDNMEAHESDNPRGAAYGDWSYHDVVVDNGALVQERHRGLFHVTDV